MFDQLGLDLADVLAPWIAILISLSAVFWFKDFAVNLMSGLKFKFNPAFNEGDHRHGNRNGEWFDKGETFAGVPFEIGVEAVEQIKEIVGNSIPLAQIALKWILMNDQVSVVIPGATKASQIESNILAAQVSTLSENQLSEINSIYSDKIKPFVHHLW